MAPLDPTLSPATRRAPGLVASFWLGLVRLLEREAGHTLIAVVLIWTALHMSDPQSRAAAAHDVLVFALGMLAKGMGATQSSSSGK